MIGGRRLVERLVYALVALVVAIQLAPLVVVALVSVSSSPVFDVTAGSWSLRWWERRLLPSVVEGAADTVPLRVTAPREAHHREGHERFTLDAIMVEEERIFDMIDDRDDAARLPVSAADVAGLSPDQERVIRAIAGSPFLVQPLQAPAGAGKTFSLAALHAAALRAGREVLVVAPTGRAVDQAMGEGAGDYGLTVAKALSMIDRGALTIGRHSLVVLDEASMLGTPQLRTLLGCTSAARAKIVTVGDSYQLAPVLARGGMFDDLMAELPWAQHLSVVWRMQDPDERDMSLALRSAHGNRLRKAVGWYRIHGRLHTGDEVTMAADARDAFVAACREGRDVLLMDADCTVTVHTADTLAVRADCFGNWNFLPAPLILPITFVLSSPFANRHLVA